MRQVYFLFFLVLCFFFPISSFASLSISPLKFEFDIEATQDKKEKIKVTNTGDAPITLYSSKEDFIAGDDSGTPKFIKPEDQTTGDFTLSTWIEIEDQNITLAPKESKEVYFTVHVPENAEPGGHYAAVFFSPGAPSGAQVAVVQRLGVLVLVNVPGEVKISGEVKKFEVGKLQEKQFITQSTYNDFPITFEAIFENSGNIHLKPTGKITLTDDSGELLRNIGKETLSTPAGAYIGEKMVDYLPINDVGGNVLPLSERKFQVNWEGFGYTVLNEDGTKSVHFKNLSDYYADKAADGAKYLMFWQSIHTKTVSKKITAEFELAYEGKDKEKKEFIEIKVFPVVYEETYIGINYIIVGILVVLFIGGTYYFLIIAPKQKAKREELLKQELLKQMQEVTKKEE